MNKIVLIPVLILLVIYIVIFHTIPSVNKVLELRELRVEKIKEVDENKGKLIKLENFQSDVVNHQEQFNFVSKFIPKDPIENDIINFLNQKAQDTDVNLFNVEPTDKSFGGRIEDSESDVVNISFLEVEVTLTGSYENIRNFLNEVFIMNRLYNFDNVAIEKIVVEEGGPSLGGLNVKFIFNYAYVLNSLAMDMDDINRIGDEGVKESYDFVDFVIESTANIREFKKADNVGRKNPFVPN